MKVIRITTLSLAMVMAAVPQATPMAGAGPEAVLPPLPEWSGESKKRALPADHEWATPFEKSGLTRSPDYQETTVWLRRLAAAAPQVEILSLGTSYQGREILAAVVSLEGASTPEELAATGRPLALVHAGIHSGEIDGKDAGMMLLRDMTVGQTHRSLLERVNLIFIPILSVDGHERSSPFGRINQRGPEVMGWRTNARNQNLNRDYAKLDTPEIRGLVAVINRWDPDLYVDLHVTDGMDFQYDITWGYNGPHAHSPAVAGWLDARLTPAATRNLETAGHIPGPLFFSANRQDSSAGVVEWTADPRFSNGYGDARHLAAIVVENHSLKPFDQRVLGTHVLLESFLRSLGEHGAELRRAAREDRERRPGNVPLAWGVQPDSQETVELRALESRLVASSVSGAEYVEWLGKPVMREVAWLPMTQVTASAKPPVAYWIPPAWPEVIERLALHGIEMETIKVSRTVPVEMYRLQDAKLAAQPFEGHARVTATPVSEARDEPFPPGSVRVPVDQPLGTLAMLLLEPASPDSFLQWGFFLEVLQRSEYVEAYVMEPTAQRMLELDAALAAEFEKRLEDEEFAADPRARLQWFYQRTPWFDERWNLYPVARELAGTAVARPLAAE